jgi:transcriptional regulator with XRE-family HTH domain
MNRLREVRVVKRLRQFDLRDLTGIHPSKISLIENGLVEPRPDEILKISKALDICPEQIFEKCEGL